VKRHEVVDRIVFGQSYPHIHRMLDQAVKHMGAGHRMINHSYNTILDFMELLYGIQGRRVALLHLLIDARIINNKQISKLERYR
jgi:hypothetical protein